MDMKVPTKCGNLPIFGGLLVVYSGIYQLEYISVVLCVNVFECVYISAAHLCAVRFVRTTSDRMWCVECRALPVSAAPALEVPLFP